jgi:hypothetical protein
MKYIFEYNGEEFTIDLKDFSSTCLSHFRKLNYDFTFIGTAHSHNYVPAMKRFRTKQKLKKELTEIAERITAAFKVMKVGGTMTKIMKIQIMHHKEGKIKGFVIENEEGGFLTKDLVWSSYKELTWVHGPSILKNGEFSLNTTAWKFKPKYAYPAEYIGPDETVIGEKFEI